MVLIKSLNVAIVTALVLEFTFQYGSNQIEDGRMYTVLDRGFTFQYGSNQMTQVKLRVN